MLIASLEIECASSQPILLVLPCYKDRFIHLLKIYEALN